MSLLVEAFLELPQPRMEDDADLWQAGIQDSIRGFRKYIRQRYTEGTLQRILLSSNDTLSRRAAVFALGLIGSMDSNAPVAWALREDADELVQRFAADTLWELWFRGSPPQQGRELRQALGLTDLAEKLAALDELARTYPEFAELYNQRAILHFRRGEYLAAVADCEKAMKLNPHHFGAASGLGECYLRMNKPRAALRAFTTALELNPTLLHLRDMINSLKKSLGEV